VTGAGLGLINVFDISGRLLRRLVSPGGVIDAPLSIAVAPAYFGHLGNALLFFVAATDNTDGTYGRIDVGAGPVSLDVGN
jgi:hypothetical protein